MPAPHPALARAEAFCAAYDLRIPILQAPMASACPPSLAIAVAKAGGMGGCGALRVRSADDGAGGDQGLGVGGPCWQQWLVPAQSMDSRSATGARRDGRGGGAWLFGRVGSRSGSRGR